VPVDELVPLAVAAEALGYDGVALGDHVVFPLASASRYPAGRDGRPTWGQEDDWPDSFVTAAAIAAKTETLEVLTAVFILAARHPLHVAKSAATAQVLSGGRLRLGLGIGWLREEFEALDQDFDTRGRRTEEAIEVLRKVWTGEAVDHHGEFFDFEPLTMQPKPVPPIPVYLGGSGTRAAERAARLCDGFVAPMTETRRVVELLAEVDRLRGPRGEGEAFDLVASADDSLTQSDYDLLAGAGASAIRVDLFSASRGAIRRMTLDDRLRALERYATTVVSRS
jgi:probable F420-dependent oxidoreductase